MALTLINVQGFPIAREGSFPFAGAQGIDREILRIPEIVAESFDLDVPNFVRPIFDTLWQSCGRERSDSYDAEDKCILKLRE